jgi:hypothetical protein
MMIICDDDDDARVENDDYDYDESDDYDNGDYTSDTFVDATMYVVDERQYLLQQALIQSEATLRQGEHLFYCLPQK